MAIRQKAVAVCYSASANLADLGISKSQSSRWQKLAVLPQEANIEATAPGPAALSSRK